MKSVAVFCGSRKGKNPQYVEDAKRLGEYFAKNQIRLVYGGASIGIMGAVAKGCLDHQGLVCGIIPKFLEELEVGHSNLSEKIEVDSMHERKELLYTHSDQFIIFPGGMGTLDEFFEILTWKQLNLHQKKIHIYNPNGFYNGLLEQLNHFAEEGFISVEDLNMVNVTTDLSSLCAGL